MLSERLQPLINLMKDQLIEYDIAAIDATTLQVLNEPLRAPETKSFAYCIRGGPPGKEVTLYEYNAYSQKDYVTETLLGFKGTVHCDASPVFNDIGSQGDVILSYCNAHARRKFEQIEKADKKTSLAKQAMSFYTQLYKIERNAAHLPPPRPIQAPAHPKPTDTPSLSCLAHRISGQNLTQISHWTGDRLHAQALARAHPLSHRWPTPHRQQRHRTRHQTLRHR